MELDHSHDKTKWPSNIVFKGLVSQMFPTKLLYTYVFRYFPLQLSDSNSVKITDVGVSKAAVDITGTLAGTPVYFAPEVIRTERYNCQADIYSLGIIMWEMWYGQQAFAEVTVPSLEAFFLMVSRGYRPKHVECCKQPPDHWKRLMYNCWNGNPQKRPTATKCLEEMTMLSAEVSGQHVK